MTNRTLKEWIDSQEDGGRVFAQERLIVATTEDVWARMENMGVKKTDLAARLGRSKAYITQLLNGTRNMTLRTLSDVAFALDCTAKVRICDRQSEEGWQTVNDVGGQRRPTLPVGEVPVVDEKGAQWTAVGRLAEAA